MVDATIIEQSRGEKREDGTSTRDEDATFTKKHGKTYHGYKGHIAVDRSKIITRCRFSTAKDHDSRYIDELTKDERVAVYADSAYDKRERRQRLRRRGVIDAIVYQRRRGQESLAPWQKRWNDLVARFRAPVEHPIGHLKQHMGYRKVRYRGLARNALDFCLTAMAYNIRRSVHLTEVT